MNQEDLSKTIEELNDLLIPEVKNSSRDKLDVICFDLNLVKTSVFVLDGKITSVQDSIEIIKTMILSQSKQHKEKNTNINSNKEFYFHIFFIVFMIASYFVHKMHE
jgi:hypothetical protein